jgi:RES domain-containing protein
MRLFRICPDIYLENYSGIGASYQDGARWNLPGNPIIYFGSSPSVAMLEMANYLPSPHLVPANYRLGIYELPDNVHHDTYDEKSLPTDWDQHPYPTPTQKEGTAWLHSNNSVALLVPSAAVPGGLDKNILFNPLHPDAKKIKIVDTMDKIYSDRMFAK